MINHLNVFQSMLNWLQASLLLCSLLESWETFVVTICNFVMNGAFFMEFVKGNLYNEKTRRKTYHTENAHILVIESRGRSRNKRQKDYYKSEGRSQSNDKIKCSHCRKNEHMKRNHRIWKKELNR